MATLYARSGSWVINWSDAQGQHRRVIGRCSALSRKEAERKLKELEYALLVSRGGAPPDAPTFEDFAEGYLRWHASEYPASSWRTKGAVEKHLAPVFGRSKLDSLDVRDIEQYKHDRLRAGASTATVTKELRIAKALLNKAIEWGVVDRNAFGGVKPPRQLKSSPRRSYTKSELERLYAASPGHAPLWRFLANTGLRRAEILKLRWTDVHPKYVVVWSSEEERTKSGKHRLIPLSPGAKAAIEQLRQTTSASGHVISPIAKESLSRVFARCARKAKTGGSLHCLRHTFCTSLDAAGAAVGTIKELAGHASIQTTAAYIHPTHLEEAVRGLDL